MVFNDDEIGERSYENYLPYNYIDPIFYRSFEGIQNLDLIRTTSSNRTNANEMKLYLEAQKDFYKNEKKLNQIPLSLEQRKILKFKREETILSMENRLRVSLELMPFETYDEFVNSDPEEISDLREEIVIKEAAEILVDSLILNQNPSRLSYILSPQ